MVKQWKRDFSPTNSVEDGPWLGFVILEPWLGGVGGQFRDAQLAAMTVQNVGYGSGEIELTLVLRLKVSAQLQVRVIESVSPCPSRDLFLLAAIDIGDPTSPLVSYHPRAKQIPGARLFATALAQVYGVNQAYYLPQPQSAVGSTSNGVMTVTITYPSFKGSLVIKQRSYEDVCPTALGVQPFWCAWPTIQASTGEFVNATLALNAGANGLAFTAPAPKANSVPVGAQYGYGVWPVITVYSDFTVDTGYETVDFPLNAFSIPVTQAAKAEGN